MSRLLEKNRKAEILTKMHLSLGKYDFFKENQKPTESQILRSQANNDQLTKELSRILESNQKKKHQLKQKLVQGPIGIDLNHQMTELRQRMEILRQNHRHQKSSRSFQSLIPKPQEEQQLFKKEKKMTFDELYNLQKEKFSALRQRRKIKRLNLQYLQMIGNKQGRKQRNKQMIEQKFAQQMRLLDEAIGGK